MLLDCTPLIADNRPRLSYGMCLWDADGDGQTEIFVTGFGCANRLLKWHQGQLIDVIPAELRDADRLSIGVAAGDCDGDGQEELYVLNTDTFAGPKQVPDRLFDRTAVGWHDCFEEPRHRSLRNLCAGRSVAVLDRLGQGRYGFVVANYGQAVRLYEMTDAGQLHDAARAALIARVINGRSLLAVPWFREDRTDLFIGAEHGPNALYRNEGDGTFREVALCTGMADEEEHARGVAAFDADGDGRLDLVLGNWDGPQRLWIRQRQGAVRDKASPAWAMPTLNRNVVVADFDNDGYEEVFFHNFGEANRLFAWRQGRWASVDVGDAEEMTLFGTGAVVGDIDNDGRLELLLSHGENEEQPLTLYRGPANEHYWLRVQPLTRFAAPARGALVRISAQGRVQTRVIDAGSGYLCQMEPVAHFGLGNVTQVDWLEVVWPGGATVRHHQPALCRTHRIVFPGIP